MQQRTNWWQELEQWSTYGLKRLNSPKWLLMVGLCFVVAIGGIYFFFPQDNTFLKNLFIIVTFFMMEGCLFFYIFHGYRKHKRKQKARMQFLAVLHNHAQVELQGAENSAPSTPDAL